MYCLCSPHEEYKQFLIYIIRKKRKYHEHTVPNVCKEREVRPGAIKLLIPRHSAGNSGGRKYVSSPLGRRATHLFLTSIPLIRAFVRLVAAHIRLVLTQSFYSWTVG